MKIRLWTLGSLEHMILPNEECIEKFKSVLLETIAAGGGDIVWGPDLSVKVIEVDEDVKNYVLKDGKLELIA